MRPEVVVVTGASAGVGRAAALEFARRGAGKVGLLARGRDGLAGAQREVESAGADALPLEIDVADADAVERAAATVERELGPIDVWVNNAMTTVFSRPHLWWTTKRETFILAAAGALALAGGLGIRRSR
jgi:NAD(P)-dependent dehydrogenase (short-subunit alcohol dehydrogenase family)